MTDAPVPTESTEPIKTPEELKKEKFLANPDQFEDLENVLVCCKRADNGHVGVLVNLKNLNDAWLAKGSIETNVNLAIGQILQKNAQTAMIKKGILAPGNGGGPTNPKFMPNLRRFLGK